MAALTADSFFNGRLQVLQEKDGYRFSLDAVIVSASVEPKRGDTVLDLGTGCGIIAMLLAFRHPDVWVTGVEIQPGLVSLARTNILQNRLESRVKIVEGDMREMPLESVGGPVDWVVCNPPFRKPLSGRLNPQAQKALARHEIHIDLAGLMHTARRCLRNGGHFATIYPAERAVDLFTGMRDAGIEPKWLQCVHGRPADRAKLICVNGKKGARPGLTVRAPLVVHDPGGDYSSEMQRILQP